MRQITSSRTAVSLILLVFVFVNFYVPVNGDNSLFIVLEIPFCSVLLLLLELIFWRIMFVLQLLHLLLMAKSANKMMNFQLISNCQLSMYCLGSYRCAIYYQQFFFPICFRSAVVYSLSLFFSSPLQLYFDKITDLTVRRSDSVLFKEALVSLATDSGLHPLIPYFTYFIADEVLASWLCHPH
jgi:hypothetical protein